MAFLGLDTFARKGIFLLYMGLWIAFGLLNHHAKSSNVKFNSATAVMMQSLLKIILSVFLFIRQDGTGRDLLKQAAKHKAVFLLYVIPSSLYAVYDVLSYVNLRNFDPTTYYLLLQLRLAVTAIIHQVMFKKKLNRNQWIAVLITTAGCIIKTIGDFASAGKGNDEDATSSTSAEGNAAKGNQFSARMYGLLLVQILSGTAAMVYNELLLKKRSFIPVNMQNLFMYLNSVGFLLGMLLLGLTGQSISEAIQLENLQVMLHPDVLAMVVIMAVIGPTTGAFLKLLDSVRKGIASALILVVLPIFSLALFGIPIVSHLLLAMVMVSLGIYLYSKPEKSTQEQGLTPAQEEQFADEEEGANRQHREQD